MFKLSARTVVILAAVCFIGLVMMQIAWIRSAYEGELSLYIKEKRQFESELQMHLKENDQFKDRLKKILENYNKGKSIKPTEQEWIITNLNQSITEVSKEKQHGLYLENFGIVHHKHEDSAGKPGTSLSLLKNGSISEIKFQKAGKLCLHCILGLPADMHDQYNYKLLLFYEKEKTAIYNKLALLIFGSFLFLLLLGLLFRQMLKKYQQEKKLSEAKNDFINNLSHELQTPVFAVQLANKLIKEKSGDQSDLKPLIAVIEKETHQLKQHAGKILELASLENEQMELHMEATSLNTFIEEKRPTLELMLQSKGGTLTTEYSKNQLSTKLDRVHFNNVLVSLTENAIKYNKNIPKLTICTGEKDDMIHLQFTDNGIGIEQQYLPFVFDKFYRVPNVKNNGTTGFGLGLSYVKQVVGLHGGEINIKSDVGKGTTVTILLRKSEAHV